MTEGSWNYRVSCLIVLPDPIFNAISEIIHGN